MYIVHSVKTEKRIREAGWVNPERETAIVLVTFYLSI